MNPQVRCATLAAGQSFARRLAEWVLARHGQDAGSLVKALILLPNRRSCLTLREAFLDCTEGRPLLLPRIQPIGDIDGEDLLWAGENESLPPAISPLRRRLMLTRLVMGFEGAPGRSHEHAARLADQLGRFIDEAAREGIDWSRLSSLAPEELQEHWQQTLEFLKLVTHHWPIILEKENAVDQAARQHKQLLAAAAGWKKTPPPHAVIAAGSTGSQPATRALLATIARLPQGMVILPGLDKEMPDGEWDRIEETHPQFALKLLLESMECPRREVQDLATAEKNPRANLLATALKPAEATAGWAGEDIPSGGMGGMRWLAADTPADEARAIALALRETLQTPGKTAALVTPDRALARMVSAQMQRFGIRLDDSAGRRISDTPPGCLLRLAIAMIESAAAPSDLLALLRHPLASAGRDPAECRRLSRSLEYHCLRGVRHAPGLGALIHEAGEAPLKLLLKDLEEKTRELNRLFSDGKPVALSVLVKAHLAFAEWLAGPELWAGEAGNQLAKFFASLLEHAPLLSQVDPESYPGLLDSLMENEQWWPRHGAQPRLHILSPMEARMQQYDLVILGSLNEGEWPALPEGDPWMSRPMRKAFGLPAPERAIGQSAHDFYLLAAAPEVLLTRARKADGAPTVPSRWLTRLETFIKGKDAAAWGRMDASAHYRRGAALMDAPDDLPAIPPPAPTPPFSARPREMRVTAIDTWLRDPYGIYARYILNLKPLDPLDEEPDAADFGNLVHDALEQFTRQFPGDLPDGAYEKLIACGEAAFAEFMNRPAAFGLWWPRFTAMAAWFIEMEKERRRNARVLGETVGEWNIEVDGKKFKLTTRIDRIELRRDGDIAIADYKTGVVPTKSEIEKGLANQLPLEALVIKNGTLQSVQPVQGTLNEMEYWKLSGNTEQCKIISVKAGIEEAEARLFALIRRFDDAAEPYRAGDNPPRHDDYRHLSRRQEWEQA